MGRGERREEGKEEGGRNCEEGRKMGGGKEKGVEYLTRIQNYRRNKVEKNVITIRLFALCCESRN